MSMDKNPLYYSPEIWGGIECTINRVGDQYYDQLEYSGHYRRKEDIAHISGLGVKKLRYPILWEFHEKKKGSRIDWTWSEKQLNSIRNFNIEPIVTLLHHGSGPSFTNLLDVQFPELFAAYAAKVALKFPWINFYTPVNEPLTTARFSGLYGFWFPHKNNDVNFVKMLLNQLKAVVLAMREIRKINPNAKLIQTEDLGKTYSKPALEYQALFENNRRWLTFDLLTGNFFPDHPMWQYFLRLGIPVNDIRFFIDNPCVPDVMGMNYYVTSERFLDEEIDKYEKSTHGSNELQTYADVEAVRVPHNHKTGLKILLREAWERYKVPLAVTEAHLNCSREEQLRWINEIWQNCCDLTKENIPVLGVTAWSLFGAYGWNKLIISSEKDYESGVFDVRSGQVRPTALATFIKNISRENTFSHPVTCIPGWWKRNIRYLHSFGIRDKSLSEMNIDLPSPLLILGKSGTLGKAFARACGFRKIHYVLLGRNNLDITFPDQIENIITKYKPWCIINAAGYVKVDEAEFESKRCFNENAYGVQCLADYCEKNKIKLVTFSSDLVFGGSKTSPYLEDDEKDPLNIYGKSKALAEQLAFAVNPEVLMIRTSTFFSPFDQFNFVYHTLNSLRSGKAFKVANDIFISPTYVPDLVNVALDLLIDDEKGIWHLSCGEEWSWGQLSLQIAEAAGLDNSLLKLVSSDEMFFKAPRPKYSVLGTTKGILLPGFEDGLRRYFEESSSNLKFLSNKV